MIMQRGGRVDEVRDFGDRDIGVSISHTCRVLCANMCVSNSYACHISPPVRKTWPSIKTFEYREENYSVKFRMG